MAKVSSDKAMEWLAEADYCERIAASNGDKSVPAASLRSYLTMQANAAKRDGFTIIATDIAKMAERVPA